MNYNWGLGSSSATHQGNAGKIRCRKFRNEYNNGLDLDFVDRIVRLSLSAKKGNNYEQEDKFTMPDLSYYNPLLAND